jgi:hypothetical protein
MRRFRVQQIPVRGPDCAIACIDLWPLGDLCPCGVESHGNRSVVSVCLSFATSLRKVDSAVMVLCVGGLEASSVVGGQVPWLAVLP